MRTAKFSFNQKYNKPTPTTFTITTNNNNNNTNNDTTKEETKEKDLSHLGHPQPVKK